MLYRVLLYPYKAVSKHIFSTEYKPLLTCYIKHTGHITQNLNTLKLVLCL